MDHVFGSRGASERVGFRNSILPANSRFHPGGPSFRTLRVRLTPRPAVVGANVWASANFCGRAAETGVCDPSATSSSRDSRAGRRLGSAGLRPDSDAVESRSHSKEPAVQVEQIKVDPDPYEPYRLSQGFRVGELLFVSGQTGIDEKGELVAVGDFHAQARP
jgi:hypothetical protein